MDPRISLVTLGVADMKAARRFYENLGWQASGQSNDDVTFFQAGGMILGLYGRKALAEDAKVDDSKPGFSGVALAYNGRDKDEVDRVLDERLERLLGARVLELELADALDRSWQAVPSEAPWLSASQRAEVEDGSWGGPL